MKDRPGLRHSPLREGYFLSTGTGWLLSGFIARGGSAPLACQGEVLALQIQGQGDHARYTHDHKREQEPNHGLTRFVADTQGCQYEDSDKYANAVLL